MLSVKETNLKTKHFLQRRQFIQSYKNFQEWLSFKNGQINYKLSMIDFKGDLENFQGIYLVIKRQILQIQDIL